MNQKTYEELVIENQKLKQENAKLKIKVENQKVSGQQEYVLKTSSSNLYNLGLT